MHFRGIVRKLDTRGLRNPLTGLLALLFIALFSSNAFAAMGASVTLASGQPTGIYPGQNTQLQITLSNSNQTSPVTGVAFSNVLPGTLPNGLKVSGTPTYTCTDPTGPSTFAGSGSLTVNVGSQNISLSGGVIPAQSGSTAGTCTIIVPVTAGTTTGNANTYTYTIVSGAVTGNDGGAVSNSGAVNQSVNIQALNAPTLSKSFSNTVLILGATPVTLSITVNNPNPVALTGVGVTDSFPQVSSTPVIVVAAAPAATSSCAGSGGVAATFSPSAGASSLSATGATIPANGSCTITVAVKANTTNGHFQETVTNTISGSSNFVSDIGIIPSDTSAQFTTQSPLSLSKNFAHGSIASGQSDTFSIVLTNSSASPLTITGLTDSPIDSIGNSTYGLKVSGATSVNCPGGTNGSYSTTANNLGITQTSNSIIGANSTCTLTVPFTATVQNPETPISYTNFLAEGAVSTSAAGVVSQSASASILVSDNLRILKSVNPSVASPGNPVQYQVTVQNWASSSLANATIVDTLSNGQTFLTGTISGINYTPSIAGAGCGSLSASSVVGDSSANFGITNIPARADSFTPGSCTVTFWSMTSTSAANNSPINNSLGANSVCYNSGAICNASASNSTSSTITTSTLTATKSFSPSGPLSEGSITTMQIVLTNNSANPITSASISDTLPAALSGTGQLRISTPANAATTCGGSPSITATPNGTSVTMNGAIIPARASSGTGAAGSCVLQVDVIGSAGTYNNTAVTAGTQVFANGTPSSIGPVNSNTAQLIYTSALSAIKTFLPSNVSSGGRSTVTVQLSNGGSVGLTGISVTDPLPAGMVLASPTNSYTTCAGNGTITGAPGASSIAMSGSTLAGGGTCALLFDVIATGSTNWVNTIPVGNISAFGGVSNQTAVVGTLVNNAPSGLSIGKQTNPSTLTFPGQNSVLTINVTNGTEAVTNMALSDFFTVDGSSAAALNGMRISGTPSVSTTCSNGVVTASPNGVALSLAGANLSANASCTISVNVTSTATGGITNYIPAGRITTSQGLTNAGQATTSLTTQSNIGITKQFNPKVIAVGQRSRLTFTLYNATAQPASGTSFTDTMPANVTVPGSPNIASTCAGATVTPSGNVIQISGADIAAASNGTAGSCTVSLDVVASAQGDYLNTIPASALTATVGGAPATNSQPTSDTLHAKQPLVVNIAFDGKTLDVGNPAGFTTGSDTKSAGVPAVLTIAINNPNAAPLTAAYLQDSLPNGLVVAVTPNASTTCAGGSVVASPSGTNVTLSGATLAANATCTVTVNVLSNISGSYVDTVVVGRITTFEGVTNQAPTSAQMIISTPPTITKDFSPAVIPANGTSTMTLYFGNANSGSMVLQASLTDTLPTAPGSVVVAGSPAISKTCPDSVTANPGSGTITYVNGGHIPAGGCTISVNVTASVPGTYTNNIPAGALQTDLGNNQQPANGTLVVSTQGYISGKVFNDNNVTPDGVYRSSIDTTISGVTIGLFGGATCSGAAITTQNSDVNGDYLFSALSAGTYSVCEAAQPTGTSNGTTTAGIIVGSGGSTGSAGAASNPTSTSSQVIGIVLNGDGSGGAVSGTTGNNFAEIPFSTLSGTVFLDMNNDGIQNGSDSGISGITVELLNASNAVIASQVTDSSGNYTFANLLPGTYSLREPTQPSNTDNGMTTAGSVVHGGTPGTATAVAVVPSAINGIILPPNTTSLGNNFAEIPTGGSISGMVFLDHNGDGLFNNNDYGLGSVPLNLTGTDVNGHSVSASVTTNSDGTYSFTSLAAGTYAVIEPGQPSGTTNGTATAGSSGGIASNPSSTTSQIVSIILANGAVSGGNNFAEVPGAGPDLTLSKTHAPVSFGDTSNTGVFTLTPHNIGSVSTSGLITVVDTLPTGMTVAAAATGSGWTCSGAVGGTSVSCTSSNSIAANGGDGTPISVRVQVASGLVGQLLTNTAVVSGGSEPPGFTGNNTASDTVAISTSAQVSGTVWIDANHNRILDPGEVRLPGWTVKLLLNSSLIKTTTTASDGTYHLTGISPGTGYEIEFAEPVTGVVYGKAVPNEQGITATNGVRDTGATSVNSGSNAGNPAGANLASGDGTLPSLTLLAGDNIVQQSLPLDPAGIVYDAVTRQPVAGAVVTITGPPGFDPSTQLVGGNATLTTGPDGFYQFLLTSTAPVGTYTLAITSYPSGYIAQPSSLIPACSATLTVVATPNPALIEAGNTAPSSSTPLANATTCPTNTAGLSASNEATTQHYFSFTITPGVSANIVNNHIPLDPFQSNAIVITKTSPLVNVTIGQLVPYVITVHNTTGSTLTNSDIVDNMPAGFKYKTGSGTLNGVVLEPTVIGRSLKWSNQTLLAGQTLTYKLMLVVGSGVQQGNFINTAQVIGTINRLSESNVASATVRVTADPLFDCSEIIGKVFDDKNANGYQDDGEPGIPNVRLATVDGLLVTTDAQGRYHIACAATPDSERGQNFVIKLDERTLPTGYRLTTENPGDLRLTSGKMSKLNFGATIHKVIRVDMQDSAFEPNTVTLKSQWKQQLDELPEKLKDRPSVVRLGYKMSGEDKQLAQQRLHTVAETLRNSWSVMSCCHALQIEEELVSPSAASIGSVK